MALAIGLRLVGVCVLSMWIVASGVVMHRGRSTGNMVPGSARDQQQPHPDLITVLRARLASKDDENAALRTLLSKVPKNGEMSATGREGERGSGLREGSRHADAEARRVASVNSPLAHQPEFLVNQSFALDEWGLDGAPTCFPPAPFFPTFLPEKPPTLYPRCAPRVSHVDATGVLHVDPVVFCRGGAAADAFKLRVTEIEPHRLRHKQRRLIEPLPALNASLSGLRFDVREAEYVRVQCANQRTEFHTRAQVRRRDGRSKSKSGRRKRNDDLHLLALGLDSASRQQLRRFMPQTLNYLRNAHLQDGMTVFEFPLQNIVADGTTGNMLALLTGQAETSLPESRRSNPNATFVDDYPWIWQPGTLAPRYRTGFFEHPAMGMFSRRLKGFLRPPADHFMWPLFTAPGFTLNGAANCENLPKFADLSHRFAHDHVRALAQAYDAADLRFAGVSFTKIAHGPYEHFGILDGDLPRWFAELAAAGATPKTSPKGNPGRHKGDGVLSRSAVLLFGDHGMRYGSYRRTPAGRAEERQSLAVLLMPTKWLKRHPAAHAALRTNQRRLTTLYDFHATLLDLGGHPKVATQGSASLGLSLLQPIRANRTCVDAHIPMHHCMCTNWREVNTSLSESLARATVDVSTRVVEVFNALLARRPKGVTCADLSLGVTESFQMLAPDTSALQFVKADEEGRGGGKSSAMAEANFFLSELSARNSNSRGAVEFKVQLTTVPGNGRFEVHAILDPATNQVAIPGEFSRLNEYGEPCTGITAELGPLCYCDSQDT
jgi:Protein of unknown function (DUF229)